MSLEKKLKQWRDSAQEWGKRCHVQEPSYSHSFGKVDAYNEVLKELGLVAKKIRDLFDKREYELFTHVDFELFKSEVLGLLVEKVVGEETK